MSGFAWEESRATGGRAAWAVLARGGGRIAAVFDRSGYLESGGALCCVGGAELPDGPLNLRLAAPAQPRAAFAGSGAGGGWSYRDGVLSLGSGQPLRLLTRTVWVAPVAVEPSPRALRSGLRACRSAASGRPPTAAS